MNHALGTWKVNFAQHRGDYSIDNERGDVEIARTGGRRAAYLIAAAPELLSELKAALRIFERDRVKASPAQYARIRAIIAKAGKAR